MNVTKKQTGSVLLVEIDGDINTITAPELHAQVGEDLEGITSLVLDFKKVAYVSSAGLRVLLVLYKTMTAQNGDMVIRHVNKDVLDIFSMTGFDHFLKVE